MSINRIGPSINNIKAPTGAVKARAKVQRADSFVAPPKSNTFSALNRPAQPLVILIEEKDASAPWWSEKLAAMLPAQPLRPELLSQSFVGTSPLSEILQSAGSGLHSLRVNLFHEVD